MALHLPLSDIDLPETPAYVVAFLGCARDGYACKTAVINSVINRDVFPPTSTVPVVEKFASSIDDQLKPLILAYHDSSTSTLYLSLASLEDAAFINASGSEQVDLATRKAVTLKAMLSLFAVAHTVVMIQPSMALQVSLCQTFRALERAFAGMVSDLSEAAPPILDVIQEQPPALCFLFQQMSGMPIRQHRLSEWQKNLEAQIVRVLGQVGCISARSGHRKRSWTLSSRSVEAGEPLFHLAEPHFCYLLGNTVDDSSTSHSAAGPSFDPTQRLLAAYGVSPASLFVDGGPQLLQTETFVKAASKEDHRSRPQAGNPAATGTARATSYGTAAMMSMIDSRRNHVVHRQTAFEVDGTHFDDGSAHRHHHQQSQHSRQHHSHDQEQPKGAAQTARDVAAALSRLVANLAVPWPDRQRLGSLCFVSAHPARIASMEHDPLSIVDSLKLDDDDEEGGDTGHAGLSLGSLDGPSDTSSSDDTYIKEPFPSANQIINTVCNVASAFSKSRCDIARPAALDAYMRNLPSHYRANVHQMHLRKAMSTFASIARGPLFEQEMRIVVDRCRQIWSKGRQLCDHRSVTGRLCVLPAHLSLSDPEPPFGPQNGVVPTRQAHNSGFRFVCSCVCGRQHETVDDVFHLSDLNNFHVVLDCCKSHMLARVVLPLEGGLFDAESGTVDVASDQDFDSTAKSGDAVASFSRLVSDQTSPSSENNEPSPSFAVYCMAASRSYNPMAGLQGTIGFIKGTSFLLPWDVAVTMNRGNDVSSASGRGRNAWATGLMSLQHKKGQDASRMIRLYIGYEYEAVDGRRFIAGTPDRPVRVTSEGQVKVLKLKSDIYDACCSQPSMQPASV